MEIESWPSTAKDRIEELILKTAKVKFNPNKMLWVISAKDAGIDCQKLPLLIKNNDEICLTNLVFLEKGNTEVGLKHIEKHEGQFKTKFGISKGKISGFIKEKMEQGEN